MGGRCNGTVWEKNACMCCSTKQIQHEEFLLFNYPKISPVRLYYFLYNNRTIRTIKFLYFIFWNFCPCVLTLVSSTSVGLVFMGLFWLLFCYFKCNKFAHWFFPSFTYLRFVLPLNWTVSFSRGSTAHIWMLSLPPPRSFSLWQRGLFLSRYLDLHYWNFT